MLQVLWFLPLDYQQLILLVILNRIKTKTNFQTFQMTSINLFPTEDKQTLRAEKLKFQFSFSAYSSYMTISDRDKELTIYLDDKAVRDQILFNVNNLSADYSRDNSFLKLLFQKTVEKINKMSKEDKALMQGIQDNMFVFETLLLSDDKSLQTLLASTSK